jgi:hypothetical protein
MPLPATIHTKDNQVKYISDHTFHAKKRKQMAGTGDNIQTGNMEGSKKSDSRKPPIVSKENYLHTSSSFQALNIRYTAHDDTSIRLTARENSQTLRKKRKKHTNYREDKNLASGIDGASEHVQTGNG